MHFFSLLYNLAVLVYTDSHTCGMKNNILHVCARTHAHTHTHTHSLSLSFSLSLSHESPYFTCISHFSHAHTLDTTHLQVLSQQPTLANMLMPLAASLMEEVEVQVSQRNSQCPVSLTPTQRTSLQTVER